MRVLLVENSLNVQKQLVRVLHQMEHATVCTDSGRSALEMIGSTHIDMVITKRIMADINGLELCRAIRAMGLDHFVYLMIAFGAETRLELASVLACGADDYTRVPFDPEQLRIKLTHADRVVTLERELTQKFGIVKRNYYQMVNAFAHTIEVFNKRLGEHCRRVGRIARQIARRHPDIKPEDRLIIEAAGTLHDIGFIGLPEPIVDKKRTELTGEETVLFRSHSLRGMQILNRVDFLRPVARLVGMHHEQVNGRGFPNGLSGDQIPLAARIIGAASHYDDLVHRENSDLMEIPGLLQQYRGYRIEPELVDILLEINLTKVHDSGAGAGEDYVYPEDLAQGMVLSRDVIMTSGAFVMSAGTRIDEGIIQKLKRYHESGNISERVYIKKN